MSHNPFGPGELETDRIYRDFDLVGLLYLVHVVQGWVHTSAS